MPEDKHEINLKDEYSSSKSLLRDLLIARRENNFVYRGISRDIECNPQIRRYYHHGETIDLEKFEFQLLYDFYKLRDGNNHFAALGSVLELVACAQHYGLPTRFIDWTRDPFVALFFAVNNNDKPDDDYYRLYYCNLDQNIIVDNLFMKETWGDLKKTPDAIFNYHRFLNLIGNRDELLNAIANRATDLRHIGVTSGSHISDSGLIFYDAPLSNDRILAQKGLFSIPTSIHKDESIEEIEQNYFHIKIKLSSTEREELLAYLENMNYSKNYLFPDLQNRCTYITERAIHREKKIKKN